jgi:hypothetical protein
MSVYPNIGRTVAGLGDGLSTLLQEDVEQKGNPLLFAVGMSSSGVPLANAPMRISAQWTFDTPPIFRDRAHTLAALGLSVNGDVSGGNTWQALQVFDAGIQVFADFNFQSDDAGALGPVMRLYHNSATPAANDIIGVVNFQGEDSAGNTTSFADIRAIIEDATNGSEDGNLTIFATVAGTAAAQLQIGNGVYGPGATGGYKGLGTANFTAVYDDNVLLSCYVFDAAMDGKVSMAKWDTKVPDRVYPARYLVEDIDEDDPDTGETTRKAVRRKVEDERIEARFHDPARKFASRLGGKYDPLDIEGYSRHWQEKRHLTSMPNEDKFNPVAGMATGAWVQRLIETVEIQAVHIWKLHERLKQLERQSSSSADAADRAGGK